MSELNGSPEPSKNLFEILVNNLRPWWHKGLSRYMSHALLIVVALLAVWFASQADGLSLPEAMQVDLAANGAAEAVSAAPAAAAGELAAGASAPVPVSLLQRQIDIDTDIPTRPRTEIVDYEVQEGDSIIGIAEKFGLNPETIMWGNKHVLNDDPHLLRPGQVLKISPVNGVLRQVYEGDTLENYAQWYKADVDDILFWPGNNLDPDNPVLTLEEWIIIPGGEREFVQFVPIANLSAGAAASSGTSSGSSGSTGVAEQQGLWPADAGPGACSGGYSGGAGGSGSFIYPTSAHFISGNNYSSFHPALDLAAAIGDPIYASDNGVVIFAGWSNWGYGYMVVIDHRNGWQTLYAHLSQWNVQCGQSVYQGNVIGLGGNTGNSTGPHLHFEMNYNGVRLNPWNYLPLP